MRKSVLVILLAATGAAAQTWSEWRGSMPLGVPATSSSNPYSGSSPTNVRTLWVMADNALRHEETLFPTLAGSVPNPSSEDPRRPWENILTPQPEEPGAFDGLFVFSDSTDRGYTFANPITGGCYSLTISSVTIDLRDATPTTFVSGGTATARHVQAKIRASAIPNASTFSVTYSTTTRKFTISSTAGAFTMWKKSLDTTSALLMLGFTASGDTYSGAATYTGAEARFHSDDWLVMRVDPSIYGPPGTSAEFARWRWLWMVENKFVGDPFTLQAFSIDMRFPLGDDFAMTGLTVDVTISLPTAPTGSTFAEYLEILQDAINAAGVANGAPTGFAVDLRVNSGVLYTGKAEGNTNIPASTLTILNATDADSGWPLVGFGNGQLSNPSYTVATTGPSVIPFEFTLDIRFPYGEDWLTTLATASVTIPMPAVPVGSSFATYLETLQAAVQAAALAAGAPAALTVDFRVNGVTGWVEGGVDIGGSPFAWLDIRNTTQAVSGWSLIGYRAAAQLTPLPSYTMGNAASAFILLNRFTGNEVGEMVLYVSSTAAGLTGQPDSAFVEGTSMFTITHKEFSDSVLPSYVGRSSGAQWRRGGSDSLRSRYWTADIADAIGTYADAPTQIYVRLKIIDPNRTTPLSIGALGISAGWWPSVNTESTAFGHADRSTLAESVGGSLLPTPEIPRKGTAYTFGSQNPLSARDAAFLDTLLGAELAGEMATKWLRGNQYPVFIIDPTYLPDEATTGPAKHAAGAAYGFMTWEPLDMGGRLAHGRRTGVLRFVEAR